MGKATRTFRIYDPENPALLVVISAVVDPALSNKAAYRVAWERYRFKRLLEDPGTRIHFENLERKMRQHKPLLVEFKRAFLHLPPRCFAVAYAMLNKQISEGRDRSVRRDNFNLAYYAYGYGYSLYAEDGEWDLEYAGLEQQRQCLANLARIAYYAGAPEALRFLIDRAVQEAPPEMRMRYAA